MTAKQYAREEVINFLIDVCVMSPLADNCDTYAEESNGKYTEQDLEQALRDIRLLLESLRTYTESQ